MRTANETPVIFVETMGVFLVTINVFVFNFKLPEHNTYAVKMKAKLNQTYTPAYEYSSIKRLLPLPGLP